MAKAKMSAETKALHRQYYNQRSRINRELKKGMSKGYIYDYELPAIPKKITQASVNRLKKQSAKYLRSKAEYYDELSDTIIPAEKQEQIYRKQKREQLKAERTHKVSAPTTKIPKGKPKTNIDTSIPTQKGDPDVPEKHAKPPREDYDYMNSDDVIILVFKAELLEFKSANAPLADKLLEWLERLITDNGKEAIADMIEKGKETGLVVTWEVVYKNEQCVEYMAQMMNYLQDQGLLYTEDVMEAMDLLEQYEDWEDYD